MDTTDQNILDLGAIAPEPRKVKLPDGTIIDVKPPKVELLVKLGFLGDKLQKAGESGSDDIAPIITQMEQLIAQIIPEIGSIELSSAQLFSLVKLISDMGISSTDKILEKSDVKVSTEDNKGLKAKA